MAKAPRYTSDGLRLVFGPREFIEVNDGVNQQMVRTALRLRHEILTAEDRVLDLLFCGMDNTTTTAQRHAPRPCGGRWKGNASAGGEKGRETPPAMVYQMSLSSMKIWKKTSPVSPAGGVSDSAGGETVSSVHYSARRGAYR
ncbi:hypothetical protein FZ928_00005 [Klebsiella pneumoniae]|uniref:Uncharacterized protein n=1 Tax=Klebsiella pneumoniae TaxID=573 RepID=A0A5C2LN37_KLEPN|nr:hypothetical protein FZ928_00005 [Klebsiella pneumoniae]